MFKFIVKMENGFTFSTTSVKKLKIYLEKLASGLKERQCIQASFGFQINPKYRSFFMGSEIELTDEFLEFFSGKEEIAEPIIGRYEFAGNLVLTGEYIESFITALVKSIIFTFSSELKKYNPNGKLTITSSWDFIISNGDGSVVFDSHKHEGDALMLARDFFNAMVLFNGIIEKPMVLIAESETKSGFNI